MPGWRSAGSLRQDAAAFPCRVQLQYRNLVQQVRRLRCLLLFHRQSVVLCQSAETIHRLHNEARTPGLIHGGFIILKRIMYSCILVQKWAARLETDGVDYALADGTQGTFRGFDNIVLAMGSRANSGIEETAEKTVKQVIVIGEAFRSPGNAVMAVNDAFAAAMQI